MNSVTCVRVQCIYHLYGGDSSQWLSLKLPASTTGRRETRGRALHCKVKNPRRQLQNEVLASGVEKHQEAKQRRRQRREDPSLPSALPSGGIAGKLPGQASQRGRFAGSFYWLNPSLLVLLDRTSSSGLGKLPLVRMPRHCLLMGRGKSARVCVGRIGGCYFNSCPTCKGCCLLCSSHMPGCHQSCALPKCSPTKSEGEKYLV